MKKMIRVDYETSDRHIGVKYFALPQQAINFVRENNFFYAKVFRTDTNEEIEFER